VEAPLTDPLLSDLAAGDERAFESLYDRFAARMYRAAWRMLGCREDAEDVVQEVFMAAVRAQKSLGRVRNLNAYLFAALHHSAGRCAERRSKVLSASSEAAEEAVAPIERSATDNPCWDRLQRAIGALPDEQREVLTLKIDGQLTFAEIAETIGSNTSTVASRYHYALKKLKTSVNGSAAVHGAGVKGAGVFESIECDDGQSATSR
jgi:RNA polymerase sigma factor (sigma-70 family)